MKQQVVILNKPIGKTPLQMVEFFKEKNPDYANSTISYAGRLDPMAHGVLILLIGNENKKREAYLHLDKMYQVKMLFGFTTDSYDLLGKVVKQREVFLTQEKIERILPRYRGDRKQKYPPFSSKPVLGKPLFYWARENRLHEITIPVKTVTIYSLQLLSLKEIDGGSLKKDIIRRINVVSGDFRQKEIQALWEKVIESKATYQIATLMVFCSSGTYMRSIAHDIGTYFGCGGVAYDIYRTQVGTYTLADSI